MGEGCFKSSSQKKYIKQQKEISEIFLKIISGFELYKYLNTFTNLVKEVFFF